MVKFAMMMGTAMRMMVVVGDGDGKRVMMWRMSWNDGQGGVHVGGSSFFSR